jgi:isoleucyl-tRNA synthetase
MAEIDVEIKSALADFDYTRLFGAVHEFCNVDLSAFYFDIRKDSLYCDSKSAPQRQATLWVMDQVFRALTAWLAPILAFTCEEAWQHYAHRDAPSVHLRAYPKIPAEWGNDALAADWQTLRDWRRKVTARLETLRADKEIGSSLEVEIEIRVPDVTIQKLLAQTDFAELCIVSGAKISAGAEEIIITKRDESCKCERCWRYLPEVGQDKLHPTLCKRCVAVVDEQHKLAA